MQHTTSTSLGQEGLAEEDLDTHSVPTPVPLVWQSMMGPMALVSVEELAQGVHTQQAEAAEAWVEREVQDLLPEVVMVEVQWPST